MIMILFLQRIIKDELKNFKNVTKEVIELILKYLIKIEKILDT